MGPGPGPGPGHRQLTPLVTFGRFNRVTFYVVGVQRPSGVGVCSSSPGGKQVRSCRPNTSRVYWSLRCHAH